MPNPLAIGVTLGGLLLDLVAPRPKPRAGMTRPSLLVSSARSRTPRYRAQQGRVVAGG
jgi:hypothetical protein